MLKLWIRTFAREFFAQHAGLFLFVFYMLFGAVEPGQLWSYNLSLLFTVCSSPVVLGIFFVILFLYAFKCLAFIKQKMAIPTYQFVLASGSAGKQIQLRSWLGLYLSLFSPLLIYIFMLLAASIFYGYYWSVLAIILYCTGLFTGLVSWSYRDTNYRFKNPSPFIILNLPVISKPYWTWPLYYALKEQTLMLIACKVLSFALFKGVIWMFADAGDDIRIFLIGLLAVVIAHSVLLATVLRFEKLQLAFVNSFPLSGWLRLKQVVVFLCVLFLPEFLMYSSAAHYAPVTVVTGIVFCLASLLSLRMCLYYYKDDMDDYLRFIFCFFITAMFVILAGWHVAFALFLLLSTIGYHHYLFYKSKLT